MNKDEITRLVNDISRISLPTDYFTVWPKDKTIVISEKVFFDNFEEYAVESRASEYYPAEVSVQIGEWKVSAMTTKEFIPWAEYV